MVCNLDIPIRSKKFKDYGRSSNFDEDIFWAHISYRQLNFLISSLHLIDTVDNDTADGNCKCESSQDILWWLPDAECKLWKVFIGKKDLIILYCIMEQAVENKPLWPYDKPCQTVTATWYIQKPHYWLTKALISRSRSSKNMDSPFCLEAGYCHGWVSICGWG